MTSGRQAVPRVISQSLHYRSDAAQGQCLRYIAGRPQLLAHSVQQPVLVLGLAGNLAQSEANHLHKLLARR